MDLELIASLENWFRKNLFTSDLIPNKLESALLVLSPDNWYSEEKLRNSALDYWGLKDLRLWYYNPKLLHSM